MKKINLLVQLCRNFFHKQFFGFVYGQNYFNSQQLSLIQEISKNPEKYFFVRKNFEEKFASFVGKGYCISFASGRMAFYAILKVWDIKPGDEIIILGFTCSVMVNAILRLGGRPVFSDIDPASFGSTLKTIKPLVTPKTKVIVVQHSFGIPADVLEIAKFAEDKDIKVIEDCALAMDSSIAGKKVGTFGDAAIFSTDHSKPINTLMGGLVFTANKILSQKILEIQFHAEELDIKHQKRLFQRFHWERRFYYPTLYSKFIVLETLKNINNIVLTKLFFFRKKSLVFLEDDYYPPNKFKRYPYPALMPLFLCQVGLFELHHWEKTVSLRKNLLKKIIEIFVEYKLQEFIPQIYYDLKSSIVPLRFVFVCTKKTKNLFYKHLGKFVNLEQIWFREPIVTCPEGPESLGYDKGLCEISEKTGEFILNLPVNIPEKYISAFEKNLHLRLKRIARKLCNI